MLSISISTGGTVDRLDLPQFARLLGGILPFHFLERGRPRLGFAQSAGQGRRNGIFAGAAW